MRVFDGCRRWGSVCTGVAIALLFAFAVAPSKSRASCGDYVMGGRYQGSMANHSQQNNKDRDHVPNHRDKPCSGPNCSQNRQPLPQTTTTIPFERLELGVMVAAPHASKCDFVAFCIESVFDPIRLPSSIFHPPRITFVC